LPRTGSDGTGVGGLRIAEAAFGGIGLSIAWFGVLGFAGMDLAGLTTPGIVFGGVIFGIIAF